MIVQCGSKYNTFLDLLLPFNRAFDGWMITKVLYFKVNQDKLFQDIFMCLWKLCCCYLKYYGYPTMAWNQTKLCTLFKSRLETWRTSIQLVSLVTWLKWQKNVQKNENIKVQYSCELGFWVAVIPTVLSRPMIFFKEKKYYAEATFNNGFWRMLICLLY